MSLVDCRPATEWLPLMYVRVHSMVPPATSGLEHTVFTGPSMP